MPYCGLLLIQKPLEGSLVYICLTVLIVVTYIYHVMKFECVLLISVVSFHHYSPIYTRSFIGI